MAHEPEPAGPVVAPPREARGRPALLDPALVRVDRRRDEDGQLPHMGGEPAEVVPEQLARLVRVVAREETLRALGVPEAGVDVARAPDPRVVGLRHEGDRLAMLLGDLLRAVLVDDMAVGCRDRVVEAEVELVLARPRLALGELDRNPRVIHPA